jgi:peptidase E
MSFHDYEQRFRQDERQAFAAEGMPAEHLSMLEASRAGIEDEATE